MKNALETRISYKEFVYKSEHPNLIELSRTDKIFCDSCDYILAIYALKSTQTTLFIVD
jgi:hypothetical protein